MSLNPSNPFAFLLVVLLELCWIKPERTGSLKADSDKSNAREFKLSYFLISKREHLVELFYSVYHDKFFNK